MLLFIIVQLLSLKISLCHSYSKRVTNTYLNWTLHPLLNVDLNSTLGPRILNFSHQLLTGTFSPLTIHGECAGPQLSSPRDVKQMI